MSFRNLNIESIVRFNSQKSSDLLYAYESGLKDMLKTDSTASHKTFAPSYMRCKRISWFRLRGVDPDKVNDPDLTLDFIADCGTNCHHYIQSRMSAILGDSWIDVRSYLDSTNVIHGNYTVTKSGYEYLIEMSDPPVRFAVDGLIDIESVLHLFEIKSIDHSHFKDLTEPLDKHIDQFKCYCTFLDLNGGFFFYIDRQYGDVKCYQFDVTDADKINVWNNIHHVLDCAKFQIVPDPLPKGDSWCTPSMCPYYQKCGSYGR